MYNFLLYLHSWNRWAVLILALVVIFRALAGWQGNKPFVKTDNTLGGIFVGLVHLQVLGGLILYFWLSPITSIAFSDFGAAMKNPELRFWAVEHITGMIIVAVVVQIGRIRSKKAAAGLKHRTAFIFYTIAFVIMLLSIPYVTRPWFRF